MNKEHGSIQVDDDWLTTQDGASLISSSPISVPTTRLISLVIRLSAARTGQPNRGDIYVGNSSAAVDRLFTVFSDEIAYFRVNKGGAYLGTGIPMAADQPLVLTANISPDRQDIWLNETLVSSSDSFVEPNLGPLTLSLYGVDYAFVGIWSGETIPSDPTAVIAAVMQEFGIPTN
ncbi:hypothetical protein [Leptolyngbya sp. Heron Island J]|uniref:hypothetical protein n=1 Tax=Leptolyngbya sp. Heron Island J TaxID=1385935 RepID=UPI001268BF96|nr:hypothetical protein [Leptolyngbya sp. Heron Island J]